MMFRISVVGASGYTGFSLVQLLLKHPLVDIRHLAVRQNVGCLYSDLYPSLSGVCDKRCSSIESIKDIVEDSDIIFFALPHTVAMTVIPKFLFKDRLIIDLSGDYRIKDPNVYHEFYGHDHKSSDLLSEFTYGLSEVYCEEIARSQKISNPGCFPTSIQLALYPLLRSHIIEIKNIFIDSKTGLSGAGKTLKQDLHFVEANQNVKAYKPFVHQHQPEMEQEMTRVSGESVEIIFIPHLVPMSRGIYSTIYVRLCQNLSLANIESFFKEDYHNKQFIRLLPEGVFPEIKNVLHTNFCDISFTKKGKNLLLFSALDNLMKGASSQAIQNMNIALGLKETEGLL